MPGSIFSSAGPSLNPQRSQSSSLSQPSAFPTKASNCYTILCDTALHILHYIILYYILCYTMLYYTILYYTILYYTIYYILYTIYYVLYYILCTLHYILYTLFSILYSIPYLPILYLGIAKKLRRLHALICSGKAGAAAAGSAADVLHWLQ